MQKTSPLYGKAFDVLKNSNLFGALSDAVLHDMISEGEEGSWKKADIIDSDISTKYLHILLSGKLKISQVDPESGRSIVIFLLGSQDIFDLFSLLDGREHIVQPVVLDHIEFLRIPLERAREWIREHPEFNETFLPYLGKHMRELEEFSESLVFHDTSTRLAKLILRHIHACKESDDEHYPVKLINNLSHESLAEMIGSVRSVVSTQMHKLKEEGAIVSRRGHLAVKNLEKLMKKCELFHH